MIFSRPLNALAAFVQACFPRIDYQALYPGTVVRQNGSNSFDVQPDSKKLPGLNNRPIESGVPGMVLTLSMSPPPRVLIGFRNADPSLPFILLWESGAVVTELDLSAALIKLNGGNKNVGRVGDAVAVTLTAAQITQIIAPPGTGGGPCSGGPITNITGTITAGVPTVQA